MRPTRLLILALLLGVFGATQLTAEYRVILRDGSWLRAESKPVAQEGQVLIRLLDGLLTAVPEGRIDWQASERWNRQRPGAVAQPGSSMPTPANPVPTTIRMVRDSSTPAPTVEVPAVAGEKAKTPVEVQPPPSVTTPPPASRDASLRRRIRRLDEELVGLGERKVDLEARARRSIHVDDAADLRAQAQEVLRRIEVLRAEQSRLILQISGRKP